MDNQKSDARYWALALRVLGTITIWIVAPILVALPLGHYLDDHYHSAPWLLLVSLGISFIVSMYGLVATTLKEFKKIEAEEKAAKGNDDKKN